MKYSYYFFKLMGLATVKYSVSKKSELQFSPSTYGTLYNTFLGSLIISLSLYLFKCGHDRIIVIEFDTVLRTIRNTIEIFAAVLILFLYAVRQATSTRILNKISYIRHFLQPFNEESCMKKLLFKNFIVIALMWVLIFSTLGIIEKNFMYFFFVSLICDLIISSMLLQYGIIIQTLRHLLKIINKNFSASMRENSKASEYVALSKFSCLRKSYLSLLNLSEDVSDFYSQPMLASTSHIFIFFILNAYYVVKLFILEKEKPCPLVLVHYSSKMLNYMISMVILTKTVTDIRSEVCEIKVFFLHRNMLKMKIIQKMNLHL